MATLLEQYKEMKRKHPDAVLLFRVGDFYETFAEDAITISDILGITLTRRGNGKSHYVELAGFPHHALDTYLPKLVRAGKRVAICEQLENPKIKPVLKREETMVEKTKVAKQKIIDLRPVFKALSQFIDFAIELNKYAEIRRKTAEIRALSQELRISPKLAFQACYEEINKSMQKTLFENIKK